MRGMMWRAISTRPYPADGAVVRGARGGGGGARGGGAVGECIEGGGVPVVTAQHGLHLAHHGVARLAGRRSAGAQVEIENKTSKQFIVC